MFKKTIFILVLMVCAISLTAEINTWEGDESLSWRTAGNWSLNLVPTAAHDVVIPAGTPEYCYVTQSGGYNAYCNSIEIENGATLRVGNAVIQVDYDVTVYDAFAKSLCV